MQPALDRHLNSKKAASVPHSDSLGTGSYRFFGLIRLPNSIRLLMILMLFYIPVQWVSGRHPGSTSIFSPRHSELKNQFLDATVALRRQIVLACNQKGVHDIFFGDIDTLSPYLVNEAEAVPGCALHRETDVTPLAPERELACSGLIVNESLPSAWNPVRNQLNMAPFEGRVIPLHSWQSKDREFGFKLLRARGCSQPDDIGGIN